MNSMSITMFRVRRSELRQNILARVKASGMVLLAMLAICGMGASAQVTLSTTGPLTLKSGTFGGFNLVATPVGSYSGSFLIACSNMPQYAYCIYPNLDQQISVSGGATTTNIVVNTSQVNQYEASLNDKAHHAAQIALGVLIAPSALLLLVFRRRSRKGLGGLLALVMMVSLGGLAGCGSTQPQNTPPGTYTFTVSATHYANTAPFASTTVTLIVN